MDEDNDRVALVRNPSKQEAQTFVVSDEVSHIEERTRRMGDLEVCGMTKVEAWEVGVVLGGDCARVCTMEVGHDHQC